MRRTKAIIQSMTVKERENPEILNASRKRRIARGAGVSVVDVNRVLKQYETMQQMMKQMNGMGKRQMKKMTKQAKKSKQKQGKKGGKQAQPQMQLPKGLAGLGNLFK
jgi:signal recognition particle GTPase